MAHKGAQNPAQQQENAEGEPSENGNIIPEHLEHPKMSISSVIHNIIGGGSK